MFEGFKCYIHVIHILILYCVLYLISLKVFRVQNVGAEIMCMNSSVPKTLDLSSYVC